MFARRFARGQCYTMPYLGCREFTCAFEPAPEGRVPIDQGKVKPLGLMLHDIDYNTGQPRFFAATMRNGRVDVPPFVASQEVLATPQGGRP